MENSNISPERFPWHTTGDSAAVVYRTQGQKFLSINTYIYFLVYLNKRWRFFLLFFPLANIGE